MFVFNFRDSDQFATHGIFPYLRIFLNTRQRLQWRLRSVPVHPARTVFWHWLGNRGFYRGQNLRW